MNTHLTTTKKIVIVFVALLAAFLIFNVSGGAASPRHHAPVKPHLTISVGKSSLSNSGGGVTVRAREHGLTRCTWTVVPKIIGFNRRVDCKAKMSRVAHIPSTTVAHAYTFVIRAKDGKKTFVARASVIENGPVPPITTTTTTTTIPSTVTTTTQPTTTTTVPSSSQTTTTRPATTPVALDPVCTEVAPLTESCFFNITDTGVTSVAGVLSFETTTVPNNPNAALTVPATTGCTINLSPTTTSGTCVVQYATAGTYYVATLYSGGPLANSASLADSVTVNPYAFTTGAIKITETYTTPGYACPTNFTCYYSYGWEVTKALDYSGATITTGQMTVHQNGFTITAPVGQTSCGATYTVDNTNNGAIIGMSSNDCTVTGSPNSGSPIITYSDSGYTTASLTNALNSSSGNTCYYYWSN